MLKSKAIELLGGSVAAAAKAIGVSYQAVDKWPNDLPARISDRVLAALAREKLPHLIEPETPANRAKARKRAGKPQRASKNEHPQGA